MRVLVTAIAHPSGMSGVQRHALNLVRCLLHSSEVTAVHFALAPWQLHLPHAAGLTEGERLHIEVADLRRGSISRNLWHLQQLPTLARAIGADLVHLSYPVPFRSSAMPCPVVTTLHDLYPFEFPQNFGFPQVIVNRLILRSALRHTDAIACVSRTTLRQLQATSFTRDSVFAMIPNCVEAGPSNSSCSPLPAWNGEPFLLSVAQHRLNKNLDLLIRSFARLLHSGLLPTDARLAIVGIQGPETPKLHALVAELELATHVVFLEDLSEFELQWCYRHCIAVVAPSSIEGFGLPVVEARLAGCRIICSDIAPFRELTGPHAHLVSLDSDPERTLCTAITEALQQPKPAPELLPEFSTATISDAYLKLYRATLLRRAQRAQPSHAARPYKERRIL